MDFRRSLSFSGAWDSTEDADAQVLAFASLLQIHLQTVCTPCFFYNGGGASEVPAAEPCSLCTVEPWTPGGLRRLALNIRSPLTRSIAAAAVKGTVASSTASTSFSLSVLGTQSRQWQQQRVRAAALEMGVAMLMSATWPIDGIDGSAVVAWRASSGLICGPRECFIWPVPHQPLRPAKGAGMGEPPVAEAIAVWPRRVCLVIGVTRRDDPSITKEFRPVLVAESWAARDVALTNEWALAVQQALQPSSASSPPPPPSPSQSLLPSTSSMLRLRSLWRSSTSSSTTAATAATAAATSARQELRHQRVVSFSPILPVLALADEFRRRRRLPAAAAVPAAAAALLQCDRLFGLSIFFGVPMVDRTRTLRSCLRTAVLMDEGRGKDGGIGEPPSRDEVAAYRATIPELAPATTGGASRDKDDEEDRLTRACHVALDSACMARARALWTETETGVHMDLRVMWSGGIDSTAALVCLLRACDDDDVDDADGDNNKGDGDKDRGASELPEGGESRKKRRRRRERLVVVLDDESKGENPSFYERFIAGGKLREELRGRASVSAVAARPVSTAASVSGDEDGGGALRSLLVTGELGDQLFGSDRCRCAFDSDADRAAATAAHGDKLQFLGSLAGASRCFSEKGLAAPWRDTLLPALLEKGLLGGGGTVTAAQAFRAWELWAAPQLQRAPFPIESTFDMLWWLDFSCKWQTVSLRCCHDGGSPLVPAHRLEPALAAEPAKGTAAPGSLEVAASVPIARGNAGEAATVASQIMDAGRGDGSGGAIRRFYADRTLECWACVKEFHERKFKDLSVWATYKEPLKHLIWSFDANVEYYRTKEKVGSLNFGREEMTLPEQQHVDSMLAILVDDEGARCDTDDSRGADSVPPAVAATPMRVGVRSLQSGAASVGSGTGLNGLLDRTFVQNLVGPGTGASDCVIVDPWNNRDEVEAEAEAAASAVVGRSEAGSQREDGGEQEDGQEDDPLRGCRDAFTVKAPFFASTDERQRRLYNPVTGLTLLGKCAALLPPAVVAGRSVLDLGACLGAMCHWAMCAGAARVVAVEAQQAFCERARAMLRRASATWPPAPLPKATTGASAKMEDNEKDAIENGGIENGQNDDDDDDDDDEKRRFQVVCSGIRDFLATCADGSFDVVVAAGVLHCFLDPVAIVFEICRVAKHFVCLEVDHPDLVVSGILSDGESMPPAGSGSRAGIGSGVIDSPEPSPVPPLLSRAAGPAPHVSEAIAPLQFAPHALVNLAGDDASFAGMALVPSRALLEVAVSALGFTPTRVVMAPHPTNDDDLRTYTGPRKFHAIAKRYFLRCERRNTNKGEELRSVKTVAAEVPKDLESLVVSGEGSTCKWKVNANWWSFSAYKNEDEEAAATGASAEVASSAPAKSAANSSSVDAYATAEVATEGAWAFDSEVAARFDREALCHIPDYESVVDASIDTVERVFRQLQETNGSAKRRWVAKRDLAVVDVGCATGYTMKKLLRRGFTCVHGVDNSDAMLKHCAENVGRDFHEQQKQQLGDGASVDITYKVEDHLHLSGDFPVDSDAAETGAGAGTSPTYLSIWAGRPLGAVIANWTLHFIVDPAERHRYLQAIHNALATAPGGGVLILTEKTRQDASTRDMYHEWKTKPPRNVSAAEVKAKSARLKGVLETLPPVWYEHALERCGFVEISVLWARFGFVTWVAHANAAAAVTATPSLPHPAPIALANTLAN